MWLLVIHLTLANAQTHKPVDFIGLPGEIPYVFLNGDDCASAAKMILAKTGTKNLIECRQVQLVAKGQESF